MKALKLIISIVLILGFSAVSRAQSGWVELQSGTQTNLSSIYFLNPMTGWTAGLNEIRITTDGGTIWVLQADFSGTEDQDWIFNSVFFVNSLTGWVVGEHIIKMPWLIRENIIYSTIDGGVNWNRQYNGCGSGLTSVFFANSSVGWAVGGCSILSTVNAGTKWIGHDYHWGENQNGNFTSAYFVDQKTGWIAAKLSIDPPGTYSNAIYKTVDGGLTVSQQYCETGTGLGSIHFLNSATGWAAGENKILATKNGGWDWTEYYVCWGANYYCTINSVDFINSSTGWAAGKLLVGLNYEVYSVIFGTVNGGINWKQQYCSTGDGLTDIHFVNSTTGWAVGNSGTMLKTTNGGVIIVNEISKIIPKEYALYQNFPNPFNPATTISFDVPRTDVVNLKVLDILGREVTVLVDEKLLPGSYETTWRAENLPSGVYFYRLTTEDFAATKKMILLK